MLNVTVGKNEISFKCSICGSICSCLKPNGAFYIPPAFKQKENCLCIEQSMDMMNFGNHHNMYLHEQIAV